MLVFLLISFFSKLSCAPVPWAGSNVLHWRRGAEALARRRSEAGRCDPHVPWPNRRRRVLVERQQPGEWQGTGPVAHGRGAQRHMLRTTS
jgi:hypothetical protein